MADERIVVFIDGSNFYHCLMDEFRRADVDFSKLAQALSMGRRLIRTYYYNAVVRREDGEERYQAQQRFFDNLRRVPYLDLRLGRLEKRGATVVEKGIDVRVATDMLWQAHNNVYDTAVLVSGDADYVPAVEAVKAIGKHVEVAFVTAGRSLDLQQTADKFVLIDAAVLSSCWVRQVAPPLEVDPPAKTGLAFPELNTLDFRPRLPQDRRSIFAIWKEVAARTDSLPQHPTPLSRAGASGPNENGPE